MLPDKEGSYTMNFKRIEIIFIVAFFFLDIFLLVSYFNRADTNYASTPSQSLNLISEMESQKIDLPNFTEEKYSVAYVQADAQTLLKENISSLSQQTGKINEEGAFYMSILSNPIQLSGEDSLTEGDRKILDDFVKSDQVLFGDEYSFFQYNQEKRQIVYNQTVNGLPIADGTSSIFLYLDSSDQVISYEQQYAGPVTEQGSKIELITDREAVETLFRNNEIRDNSRVKRPILTFYRSLKLEDLNMYAPAWYIQIEESNGMQLLRVDAINGSIVKDIPSNKPEEVSPPKKENENQQKDDSEEELLPEEELSEDEVSWSPPTP